MERRTLCVRWLLNPDQQPQKNCRLVIEDNVLVDIRPARVEDGDVLPLMVVPPLVNAHTHLEFSTLSQPLLPPTPFPDWIRSVIRWRNDFGVAANAVQIAIDAGLEESADSGVQLVGEIATSDPVPVYAGKTKSLIFREVIGLRVSRCAQQLLMLDRFLKLRPEIEAAGGRVGISPHAPYSVHPDFLYLLATTARQEKLPLAMHLGETWEEQQLLEHGTGPFAEFLKSLDLFDADIFRGGRCLTDYLEQLLLAPHALAIHGNWFGRGEWDYLRQHPTITVVYCPRTHHWFGHPSYPLQEMLAAGVRVVLGTDSRASNPDLGVWNELQHVLQHHPSIDPLKVLAMVTTAAAAALGWPEVSQPVQTGKPFNATILECPKQESSLREEMSCSRVATERQSDRRR